jgi:hypothetical protein
MGWSTFWLTFFRKIIWPILRPCCKNLQQKITLSVFLILCDSFVLTKINKGYFSPNDNISLTPHKHSGDNPWCDFSSSTSSSRPRGRPPGVKNKTESKSSKRSHDPQGTEPSPHKKPPVYHNAYKLHQEQELAKRQRLAALGANGAAEPQPPTLKPQVPKPCLSWVVTYSKQANVWDRFYKTLLRIILSWKIKEISFKYWRHTCIFQYWSKLDQVMAPKNHNNI